DAALGVAAVPAHVPLADGAARAGNRVGPAHDARHEVAAGELARGAGVEDASERLVPEDEARPSCRGPSVVAFGDLDVRAADADGDRLDEDRSLALGGLRHVL